MPGRARVEAMARASVLPSDRTYTGRIPAWCSLNGANRPVPTEATMPFHLWLATTNRLARDRQLTCAVLVLSTAVIALVLMVSPARAETKRGTESDAVIAWNANAGKAASPRASLPPTIRCTNRVCTP